MDGGGWSGDDGGPDGWIWVDMGGDDGLNWGGGGHEWGMGGDEHRMGTNRNIISVAWFSETGAVTAGRFSGQGQGKSFFGA